MLFDSHAHYYDTQFDLDRQELLQKMKVEGIEGIINVSSTIDSWQATLKLTRDYDIIYGTIGVHPDDVGEMDETRIEKMENLLSEKKIVAVGEIGLDYYWDTQSHEMQKAWFVRQLDIAKRHQLPVIIHSREAAEDTLNIMKARGKESGGIIHCFAYSKEIAREYVKLGYYIGIGGVITFKNAKKLKEVVKEIPLERIVLETDCPYLAPVPNRGKRNSSLNLKYIAEEIADIKDIGVEQVIEQTTLNAKCVYRL